MILTAKARYGQLPIAGVTPYVWLRLILEVHPQITQLFRKRVPAFCCLGRSFGGGLDGLGAFIGSRFDQPKLVGGICLGPLECGNQFSMGNGWIHSGSPINQRRDS